MTDLAIVGQVKALPTTTSGELRKPRMLMRPKHSLDRLLTLKASAARDLMGSITANVRKKWMVNVGISEGGPSKTVRKWTSGHGSVRLSGAHFIWRIERLESSTRGGYRDGISPAAAT